MRKTLKRFLPDHAAVHSSRWLRPFSNTLLHPRLWHLNRHSAAGGVAIGLFCGLIPGPLQMPAAAVACTILRVNLPLALIVTLYTNPLTIVPVYLLAYSIGSRTLGLDGDGFIAPPDKAGLGPLEWLDAIAHWMAGLGGPLALGLLLLAIAFSSIGYVAMRAAWRTWLIHAWRTRARRRACRPPPR